MSTVDKELLHKIKKWWNSDQNPQKDNSFKRITLPLRNQAMVYREATSSNSGHWPATRNWPMQLHSRFILKYGTRFTEVTAVDIYYGTELRFQVEDRSYSGYPIKEFTKFSSFDFIDSSIAICVFFQPSQTFLCVLDVNLEMGKLIVHQLVDLNHEGQREAGFRHVLLIDRQAGLYAQETTHRIFVQFRFQSFYKRFKLTRPSKNNIPKIYNVQLKDVSYRQVATPFVITNQVAHSFTVDRNSARFRRKPNELIASNLRTKIDGHYPKKTIEIRNLEDDQRSFSFKYLNTRLYFLYTDQSTCEVIIVDFTNFVRMGSIRFEMGLFNQCSGFCVNEDAVMLHCREKDNKGRPDEVEIYNNLLVPIRRPFPLTKLASHAVYRHSFKHPEFGQILKNSSLASYFQLCSTFRKLQSIHDDEFRQFCSTQCQK